MAKILIEQFEPALIHRMLRIRADVDAFAEGDEFSGFRFLHGGSPGEWRTNLRMALDSLQRLEHAEGSSSEIEEIVRSSIRFGTRCDVAIRRR